MSKFCFVMTIIGTLLGGLYVPEFNSSLLASLVSAAILLCMEDLVREFQKTKDSAACNSLNIV